MSRIQVLENVRRELQDVDAVIDKVCLCVYICIVCLYTSINIHTCIQKMPRELQDVHAVIRKVVRRVHIRTCIHTYIHTPEKKHADARFNVYIRMHGTMHDTTCGHGADALFCTIGVVLPCTLEFMVGFRIFNGFLAVQTVEAVLRPYIYTLVCKSIHTYVIMARSKMIFLDA
jgi:hypothetical protein